jgi:hypothetical protein
MSERDPYDYTLEVCATCGAQVRCKCAQAERDALNKALTRLVGEVSGFLLEEYPDGHFKPADRLADKLSHANVVARAALAASVSKEEARDDA